MNTIRCKLQGHEEDDASQVVRVLVELKAASPSPIVFLVIAVFLWFSTTIVLRSVQAPLNYVARHCAEIAIKIVQLAPYVCLCAPLLATLSLDGRGDELTPDAVVLLAGSWCIATILLFTAAPMVSRFVFEAFVLVGRIAILALHSAVAVLFLVCVVLGVADIVESLGAASTYQNGGLNFVCS